MYVYQFLARQSNSLNQGFSLNEDEHYLPRYLLDVHSLSPSLPPRPGHYHQKIDHQHGLLQNDISGAASLPITRSKAEESHRSRFTIPHQALLDQNRCSISGYTRISAGTDPTCTCYPHKVTTRLISQSVIIIMMMLKQPLPTTRIIPSLKRIGSSWNLTAPSS